MSKRNDLTAPEVVQPDGWYSNEAATFGDRVAAGREALGISQSELAKQLGIKLRTLQHWENDLSEPRANKLMMLSGVLNLSLRWLLSGEGEGLSEPEEISEMPPDVRMLLADLRELRAQAARTADRLGILEKRLRTALKDNA